MLCSSLLEMLTTVSAQCTAIHTWRSLDRRSPAKHHQVQASASLFKIGDVKGSWHAGTHVENTVPALISLIRRDNNHSIENLSYVEFDVHVSHEFAAS